MYAGQYCNSCAVKSSQQNIENMQKFRSCNSFSEHSGNKDCIQSVWPSIFIKYEASPQNVVNSQKLTEPFVCTLRAHSFFNVKLISSLWISQTTLAAYLPFIAMKILAWVPKLNSQIHKVGQSTDHGTVNQFHSVDSNWELWLQSCWVLRPSRLIESLSLLCALE